MPSHLSVLDISPAPVTCFPSTHAHLQNDASLLPPHTRPPPTARSYLDAARCFNAVLLYIYRVKAAHRNSPQYEQMLKKNEQMYSLLAVCLALCPAAAKSLDENVLMQVGAGVGGGWCAGGGCKWVGEVSRGHACVFDWQGRAGTARGDGKMPGRQGSA